MANPNWTPGTSGNPLGKPKGSPNKTTMMVRQLFASILEEEQENFKAALETLRTTNPKVYVETITKLSQRFLPEMTQTALVGLDGESIQPVQIVLPNDPNRDKHNAGPVEDAELLSDPDSREPKD
jgi:hypothetical protein